MPDRRSVLFAGLAAASACLPLRLQAREGFSLDDFIALSSRLTDAPVATLDREAARIMYEAFDKRGLLPDIARLARQTHPRDVRSQFGDEIVAAWYSGVCLSAHGPVVAAYTSALIWTTTSFLHPPGTCGGPTGYWGDPPAA